MPLDKLELRTKLKKQRDSMRMGEVTRASNLIQENLLTLPEILNSKSFFTYVSVDNEVKTLDLITYLLSQSKTITVPKISKWGNDKKNIAGIMYPHKITSVSQLRLKGKFLSPHNAKYEEDLEVAICPVLAVSENMERLGMGGGFYDKFVESYPNMKLIALAYEWQVKKELPTAHHDKLLDVIVTEDRIIRRNNQF